MELAHQPHALAGPHRAANTTDLPAQRIPRRIIQTGRSWDDAWATHSQYIRQWQDLNPEWEYRFYSDPHARRFVDAHADADEKLAYQSLVTGAQRADLFRVLALKYRGGAYADLDSSLTKPLHQFVPARASAVVGKLWGTEMMLFAPRHTLLARIARTLTFNIIQQLSWSQKGNRTYCRSPHKCVLHVTGPFAFRWAVGDAARDLGCSIAGIKTPRHKSPTGVVVPSPRCIDKDVRAIHVCMRDSGSIYRTYTCDASFHWDCRNSGATRKCGSKHYSKFDWKSTAFFVPPEGAQNETIEAALARLTNDSQVRLRNGRAGNREGRRPLSIESSTMADE